MDSEKLKKAISKTISGQLWGALLAGISFGMFFADYVLFPVNRIIQAVLGLVGIWLIWSNRRINN